MILTVSLFIAVMALFGAGIRYFNKKIQAITEHAQDLYRCINDITNDIKSIQQRLEDVRPVKSQAQVMADKEAIDRLNEIFDVPYTGIDEEFGL